MSVRNLLIVVLVIALLGGLPALHHGLNWGYWPTGGIGGVLLVIIVLMLLGII